MSTLTVIISSSSHNPHKFTLELSRQCSILQVKEIITTRLDSKFTVADQRLIYAGRILDDKDTLEHVFEKVDCTTNPPTIHLAVPSIYTVPSPTQKAKTTSSTDSTTTATTTTPFSSIPTGTTGFGAAPGINPNIGHSFIPFTTTSSMNHQDTATSSFTSDGANSVHPSAANLESPVFSSVPFSGSTLNQPMQYAMINGMPYLVPATYLPILMHQHNLQQAISHYGAYMMSSDGMASFQHTPAAGHGAAAAAGAAVPGAEQNAQDIAARDQRRAASLWLLMKLAFGVYLFSQNGSIERILLLHIAALIIFLQQTGRLRIVRRIGHLPPGENPQAPAPNAARATPNAQTHQNTATTTTTATTSHTSENNGSFGDNQSSSSTNPHDTATSNNDTGGSNTLSSPQSSSTSQSYSATSTGVSTDAADALRHRNPHSQAQSQEAVEQGQQEPRVSAWRSINHALLTFVTSLVPSPPPEIDQAVANAAAAGERGM
ncbi:hypothetical protein BGZ46_006583 [Entomortierella lignicola]|nr:hypothetical protein BGZ46_006583 [Entomortierella lignicola]